MTTVKHATMRQYVTDLTGLLPVSSEPNAQPTDLKLLITVIDGEVTEVAPRRAGDRGWGIPLATVVVS